jgi:TolB-like protein/predicted Zn-dependent protease
MSEATKAVFLSYASQDAEAAKRICEALRAAGVEVWFDQSELVGGDAWDQKIRRQIKECALLIPIISAATQARTEGYFRLEWRLADQRTHLMAKGRPFLLPVVIDDTRDADAHVPDSFAEVQWTRLPGGETSPAFASRVKKLLIGEIVAGVADPGPPAPPRPATSSKRPRWLAPVIGGAVVALLALVISRPWEQARSPSDAPRPTEAVKPAAPLTEAQKLVAQARKIYEDGDELNRDNLYLAEELVQRATALDPVEPAAWELATWLSYTMVWHSIEDTQARRESLLRQANRAVALAPDSVAAQLVFANAQLAGRFGGAGISQGRFGEIEANLKRLAEREPQNWKIQRALGTVYRLTNRMDEAIRTLQRAIELSGEHPMATADLVNVLIRNDRYAEAEKILTRSLGHQRSGRLLTFNLIVKCRWRGDVVGAAKDIADWPEWLLQQDRGFAVAWQVALWARQPDQALQLVQQFPRQYVHDLTFSGPRAVLSARAQELAGNSAAAQADWHAVLQQCDQDLAANSSNVIALYWKAWALARLGDQAAAQAAATLLRQRLQTVPNNYIESYTAAALWATVGWADVAISALRGVLERPLDYFSLTRAYLEVEPAYDPIRQDPRFQALVEQAPAPKNTEDKGQTSAVSDSIDQKSVAVLPFENRSASGEDAAFLSDGIHEDLINTLSRVPGLKVMSRTAVQRFKGSDASMADIAATLKVSHVVEAGVQRAGNQVRINVQLVQTADGQTVWSEHYDRTLSADGIFALQEEITMAVAKALKLQLEPGQDGRLITGTTKNLAAYEAFLKGRLTWKSSGGNDQEAIAQFKRAVELDPDFAIAYGAMAEAYISVGNSGQEAPAQAFPLAKAAADRALAIDPRCIQALTALGEYAFHYEWDWAKADRLLRQALAVDPNYAAAYGWLAGHLKMMNRAAEAKVMLQRKAELEPERPLTRQRNELDARLEAKQFTEAIAIARGIAQQMPGTFVGSFILGSTLRSAGQPQEAVQIMEKAVGEFPDQLHLYEELGISYAGSGQPSKARAVLARLTVIREARFVSPLIFAAIATALDDRDLAFAEIERAFQVHDPMLPSIGVNDDMASLTADPRFRNVLKRLKLDTVFPETVKP